jgi:protein gp37
VSSKTKIEWTRSDDGAAGATWNPVTGCTEVSPGCNRCYAKTFAERLRGCAPTVTPDIPGRFSP